MRKQKLREKLEKEGKREDKKGGVDNTILSEKEGGRKKMIR